jgi:hypothetical protein
MAIVPSKDAWTTRFLRVTLHGLFAFPVLSHRRRASGNVTAVSLVKTARMKRRGDAR